MPTKFFPNRSDQSGVHKCAYRNHRASYCRPACDLTTTNSSRLNNKSVGFFFLTTSKSIGNETKSPLGILFLPNIIRCSCHDQGCEHEHVNGGRGRCEKLFIGWIFSVVGFRITEMVTKNHWIRIRILLNLRIRIDLKTFIEIHLWSMVSFRLRKRIFCFLVGKIVFLLHFSGKSEQKLNYGKEILALALKKDWNFSQKNIWYFFLDGKKLAKIYFCRIGKIGTEIIVN